MLRIYIYGISKYRDILDEYIKNYKTTSNTVTTNDNSKNNVVLESNDGLQSKDPILSPCRDYMEVDDNTQISQEYIGFNNKNNIDSKGDEVLDSQNGVTRDELSSQLEIPIGLHSMANNCFLNVSLLILLYLIHEIDIIYHECIFSDTSNCTSTFDLCETCLLYEEHEYHNVLFPPCKQRKLTNGPININNSVYHNYKKKTFNSDLICDLCIIKDQLAIMKSYTNPIPTNIMFSFLSYFNCKFGEQDDPGLITTKILSQLQRYAGKIASIFTCTKCGTQTFLEQELYDLQLCIPSGKESSIEELIKSYFKAETIDKECSKCYNTSCTRTEKVLNYPKYLQVNFKRYNYNNQNVKKNDRLITFQEILTLPKYDSYESDSQIQEKFNLKSVIVHTGMSSNYGHYYCFINYKNTWWKIDNTKVEMVNWDQVKREKAYYLFYSKTEQITSPSPIFSRF